MLTHDFLRRAITVALVMATTGVMACGDQKGADDSVPADAARADAATGGMAGATAEPAPTVTPETQRALDAGNAAYRAKDYATALAEFEKAATLAPQHAAPWFGIYMVAQVRKDAKKADAALAEIRRRSEAPSMPHPELDGAPAGKARARTGAGTTGS